jgi:hypothetical protein
MTVCSIVLAQLRGRGPLLPAELETIVRNFDPKTTLNGYEIGELCGADVVLRSKPRGGVEWVLAVEESATRRVGALARSLSLAERLFLREQGDRVGLIISKGKVERVSGCTVADALAQASPRGVSAFTLARLHDGAAEEMRVLLQTGAAFAVGLDVWATVSRLQRCTLARQQWSLTQLRRKRVVSAVDDE